MPTKITFLYANPTDPEAFERCSLPLRGGADSPAATAKDQARVTGLLSAAICPSG